MDINIIVTTVYELLATYALKVLGAVLVLIGGWMVAKWARGAVQHRLERTRLDATLAKFFASMASWVILIAAVIASLEAFGVQTTSLVAVLGAASLAIGLAFQGTLSSFASGVMLLIFRPFKVGDAVNVAGVTGKVDEIDLFMTRIDTFDNRRFFIPNNKIFGSNIETITFHPRRRVDVPVGTAYDADLDATRAVLEGAVAGVPGALEDPAPQIWLDGLGDSAVNWVVRVWAEAADFGNVKQATVRHVKMALDEAGIGIPFPQMDVHLDRETDGAA